MLSRARCRPRLSRCPCESEHVMYIIHAPPPHHHATHYVRQTPQRRETAQRCGQCCRSIRPDGRMQTERQQHTHTQYYTHTGMSTLHLHMIPPSSTGARLAASMCTHVLFCIVGLVAPHTPSTKQLPHHITRRTPGTRPVQAHPRAPTFCYLR